MEGLKIKKGIKNSTNGLTVLRIAAILTVIGITVYIYSIRDRVGDFAAYGYPGIFLIALMANATVFLPAPGVAVVFTMGSIFNPIGGHSPQGQAVRSANGPSAVSAGKRL